MGIKLNKDGYTKLIEDDLKFLNEHCPEGHVLDHVKLVLCDSIDMHYPKPKKSAEALPIAVVVGQSEQVVCDCGDSNMTWYGNDDDKKWFCFNCKKEAN